MEAYNRSLRTRHFWEMDRPEANVVYDDSCIPKPNEPPTRPRLPKGGVGSFQQRYILDVFLDLGDNLLGATAFALAFVL